MIPDADSATFDDILAITLDDVSAATGVAPDAILGRSRVHSVAQARKRVYVALQARGIHDAIIAHLVGRDRTTIIQVAGETRRRTP